MDVQFYKHLIKMYLGVICAIAFTIFLSLLPIACSLSWGDKKFANCRNGNWSVSHVIITPSASAAFVMFSLPCLLYTFSEEVTSTLVSHRIVCILKTASLASILGSMLVTVEVSELHTVLAVSGAVTFSMLAFVKLCDDCFGVVSFTASLIVISLLLFLINPNTISFYAVEAIALSGAAFLFPLLHFR